VSRYPGRKPAAQRCHTVYALKPPRAELPGTPLTNGRSFSIELSNESDIEAFCVEMPEWVAFANVEFGRRQHTPAEEALAEAKKRAQELEDRLRRSDH
jgi:hypothetical protein